MLPVGSQISEGVLRDQYGADVRVGAGPMPDVDGADTVTGPMVMFFFPAAFTSVCSSEMRELRGPGLADLVPDDSLLAVSCDSFLTLRAFAEAENIYFRLLSDFWPHGEVSTKFDAFDPVLGTSTRTTYIIDGDGVVRWNQETGLRDARDIADIRTAFTDMISESSERSM